MQTENKKQAGERTLLANPKLGNMSDWQSRHNAAILAPNRVEAGIVVMLKGLQTYAEQHKARYESTIGEDGVLGDGFLDIAKGIRVLLNGETGRLDCGTLDAFILDLLSDNGFNTEEL